MKSVTRPLEYLQRVEGSVGSSYRGQCKLCGRRSYRWATWRNVERWYSKHYCEQATSQQKAAKT